MTPLWVARAAINEALFREVNERIEELHTELEADGSAEQFICECSDPACTERVTVPLDVYERVRANPRRFFVKPGHEERSLERVVERDDGFLVVEKDDPTAARIAEQAAAAD